MVAVGEVDLKLTDYWKNTVSRGAVSSRSDHYAENADKEDAGNI